MAAASIARLRAMEARLSSTRKTAKLLGISNNMAWRWRSGCADLTPAQLAKLENFLYSTLATIEILALRGGRKGAA